LERKVLAILVEGCLRNYRCTPMKTLRNQFTACLSRRRNCERGVEVVEMAFILPVLMMLLLGIFFFGRGYNVYETMTRAAREGVRVAVAPACSACSGGGQLPSMATVASVVQASLVASNLDPTQVACGTCPGTCNGSAPTICYRNNVVLNPSTTPAEYGVVVSFTYPFQMAIPFVNFNQSLTLSTSVQMRQEN
jgi:Flp pilus assembly protein TadG